MPNRTYKDKSNQADQMSVDFADTLLRDIVSSFC